MTSGPNHHSNGDLNPEPTEEEAALIRSIYPFYIIDGVHNFRDVGGYPCYPSSSSSSTNPINSSASNESAPKSPLTVRKSHIFRSGETSSISALGKTQLTSLGIKKIFDLRSEYELAKYDMEEIGIEGVEVERIGIKEGVWYDPVSLEMRLRGYAEDEVNTFISSYKKMMIDFAPCYEKIIRQIISRPSDPCLVHCTAGKDRTGVFFGLLLMLLSVPDTFIIRDYALTTAGIKPLLPKLEARFRSQTGFQDNWRGTLGMCRSNPESMRGTLNHIRAEYGGAEGYFLKMTNLTEEDLESVRRVLVVKEEGGDDAREVDVKLSSES